jgi:hypothetical protein
VIDMSSWQSPTRAQHVALTYDWPLWSFAFHLFPVASAGLVRTPMGGRTPVGHGAAISGGVNLSGTPAAHLPTPGI